MTPLKGRALRILGEVPGLGVAPNLNALQLVEGRPLNVVVEYKRHVGAAQAWEAIRQLEAYERQHAIVVAEETTQRAREILAEHNIGVVDALGNIDIRLPGLIVCIQGKPSIGHNDARRPTVRLTGKAGVAAQALVLGRDRDWKVKDLANEAAISVGLAHRVIARLEDERILNSEGAGPQRIRRLADPAALLDLWVEECKVGRVETTLAYRLAQMPRDLARKVSKALRQEAIEHAFTGAAAAAFLAPFITAVPVTTLWVTTEVPIEDLATAARADIVQDGHNLMFLQAKDDTPLAFAKEQGDVRLANPLRIFLDLRRDPRRGKEQADNFRSEVIGL